jgi:hypothetical protein
LLGSGWRQVAVGVRGILRSGGFMTSQTSRNTSWRRAVTGTVASSVLAAGLIVGFGSGTASADVLDDINAQYDIGSSGGQVSNLIHSAMKLRAQGYLPSVGNMEDLQAGMAKRPNEGPLIVALQHTVAFQQRNQARGSGQPAPQQTAGLPPGLAPGGIMLGGPGISSNIPIG